MEENKTKETLYIPQGLKQNREYFEGFGKKEWHITLFGTLIGSGIDAVFYLFHHNLIILMFILLSIPATIVMCVIKENNISVVDQIGFIIHFSNSQKQYPYEYQEEWK